MVEYKVGAWRLPSGSQRPFDDEAIRAMARADFDRTPDPRTMFDHAQLSSVDGWTGRLDEITAPALIIHGTDDPVLPFAHGLALHASLRGSTLLALDGTGHELHHSDWPRILDAMERHTTR